jgi:hypothetical protein
MSLAHCDVGCPCRKPNSAGKGSRIAQCFYLMREACSLIWSAPVLLFRSRTSLAAEILVLRHQINILRRRSPKRQTFSAMDRLIFAGLYRFGANSPKRTGDFEARYRYKVAPRRVQIVLALEVTMSWWPTNCTTGDTQAYPRDEHCQSAVGSAADPRRVAQARHRYRPDDCEKSDSASKPGLALRVFS